MHNVEIPIQNHNFPAIARWVNQEVWTFRSQYLVLQ
jgi:hypothetical protein